VDCIISRSIKTRRSKNNNVAPRVRPEFRLTSDFIWVVIFWGDRLWLHAQGPLYDDTDVSITAPHSQNSFLPFFSVFGILVHTHTHTDEYIQTTQPLRRWKLGGFHFDHFTIFTGLTELEPIHTTPLPTAGSYSHIHSTGPCGGLYWPHSSSSSPLSLSLFIPLFPLPLMRFPEFNWLIRSGKLNLH